MRIFIICPVRKLQDAERARIQKYIEDLERRGHKVHWPPRDTPQDDPVGINICAANRAALEAAEEVHVWYNPESQGSLFDLGMAWALRKSIRLINDIVPTSQKSFANVLLAWARLPQ